MFADWENLGGVVKSFLGGFWILFSVCSVCVGGQEGDGCGHTVLGTESGTLASQNYPGTYPSDTWCKWRLRVPEGRTLRLLFGDFDVEMSPGCGNGSLVITDKNGEVTLGPVCGKFDATLNNVTFKSNEVTVTFKSGPHRSGRGFLLSYATDQYPDLISCLQRGSHFSSQHLSVYCPAGCKNVTGDVWGNSEQGYRDTSVLCKSAVHAGAAADSLGGRVTVTRGRSLTLYEATFANGILSKMGSLSEKKLLFSQGIDKTKHLSLHDADVSRPYLLHVVTHLNPVTSALLLWIFQASSSPSHFTTINSAHSEQPRASSCFTVVKKAGAVKNKWSLYKNTFYYTVNHFHQSVLSGFWTECNSVLAVSGLNASSFGNKNSQEHRMFWSSRNMDSTRGFLPWSADSNDPNPWVELELRDKNTITGIITTGSNQYYIESYILLFSKDRKNWKFYKSALSKEKKLFQAYTDGHLRVLNSLFPPMVARFVRLQPLTWHGRASAQIQVLGCPASKVTPKSRSEFETPFVKINMGTPYPSPSLTTTEGPVLVETRLSSSQPVIVAVGVVLGLIMCGSCLLAGVWWKRRKKDAQMKYSLPTNCQSFEAKCLPCPHSELISYPLERNVHDALPSPPPSDYAEPAVAAIGQKVGSTFRPSSEECYTSPFTFNHYDTPGNQPEYAEPLPPEPEYATPFSEQPESNLPNNHSKTHGPAPTTTGAKTTSSHTQYDCPSHRILSNGYCTPAQHGGGLRPVSVVYAEPKSSDALLQKHTHKQHL
ncbi:discoidin, CUB and LCCL domain-containing protein 1 isoform X2 [Mastacembelus armatus]|uniref:discoidin, CUB and LCCL domain-containing protein 1 isoform X2 n=1 Tax=Mastacembelus armatus TaxID=205130 RepID=UPI000E457330|nr:discoidin, CUB and LCCL domain-containing protein 1-like isoform X2 [Mastacembelus armatus]